MNRKTPLETKPPPGVSPRRLRPRRILRSEDPVRALPAKSPMKTNPLTRSCIVVEKSPVRPVYEAISSDLRALAKRVEQEFKEPVLAFPDDGSPPLFERGRLYEVYLARRNERLKRKKGEIFVEETQVSEAVVVNGDVDLGGRRRTVKKEGVCLRKSMPPDFSVGRLQSLRSSVRVNKENRRPSIPMATPARQTAMDGGGGRKVGVRTSCRK
ncbi:hypothetical protein QJS10_CPA01g00274 [Acorus calamus]|uniref:Uncharacterized protein n=1 Tax=Acorus calamus TaxID=4465 RepID=A0AAV9FFL5_ACOCL|nr:hypothetical protein QJS10_CPA01g00274 [Acorus calamus]